MYEKGNGIKGTVPCDIEQLWNTAWKKGMSPHDARIPPEIRKMLHTGKPVFPARHQLYYFYAVDEYQRLTGKKGTANFTMDQRWRRTLLSCCTTREQYTRMCDLLDAAACWKVPERVEKCEKLGYNDV